jgi:hypothetical protein
MPRIIVLSLALVLGLAAASIAPVAGAAELTFSVEPASVTIDTFYDGRTLAVRGQAPAGSAVVVRVVGEKSELHMKEKGKVFGLLWMNLDSLAFSGVPSVFIAAASTGFFDLGPAGEALGLSGLEATIGVEGAVADKPALVAELVNLKKQEGLYREDQGLVRLGQGADGSATFSADIGLPSRLSPGTYRVEAFALQGGAVVAQGGSLLPASLVSTPAFLARMAFDHGGLYGVLATIIALLAGLAIGLVFQSKGAH